MREQSRWTAPAFNLLRELLATGTSYREIAYELRDALGISFTRNAVAGKCFRHGINNGIVPNKEKMDTRAKRREARRLRRNVSVALAFLCKKSAPEPIPDKIPNSPSHPISMLELTNTTCRWPIGEPKKPGFGFCGASGADLQGKHPYCRAHELQAWRRHE